jgi:hypothetical protein
MLFATFEGSESSKHLYNELFFLCVSVAKWLRKYNYLICATGKNEASMNFDYMTTLTQDPKIINPKCAILLRGVALLPATRATTSNSRTHTTSLTTPYRYSDNRTFANQFIPTNSFAQHYRHIAD